MLFILWAILFILTDWKVPCYIRKQPNPYQKLLFLILWLGGWGAGESLQKYIVEREHSSTKKEREGKGEQKEGRTGKGRQTSAARKARSSVTEQRTESPAFSEKRSQETRGDGWADRHLCKPTPHSPPPSFPLLAWELWALSWVGCYRMSFFHTALEGKVFWGR